MSIDAIVEELFDDASPALRDALRRAYETGFREALARRSEYEEPEALNATVPSLPAQLFEDGALEADGPQALAESPRQLGPARDAWNGEARESPLPAMEWADGEASAAAAPATDANQGRIASAKPILPHATIGTLRERIVEAFALERFEIDVILCRKGDPNRRQLKSSVRLSKYLPSE